MVGYIKHHFFVRYREFVSWQHLNQLAESWLREEADRRVHGTVKEVVAERFAKEQPHLRPLPRRVQKYKRTLRPTRRPVAEFIYHYHGELSHQRLGNAFVFLDTTGPVYFKRAEFWHRTGSLKDVRTLCP